MASVLKVKKSMDSLPSLTLTPSGYDLTTPGGPISRTGHRPVSASRSPNILPYAPFS
jgi:hypothetical protein